MRRWRLWLAALAAVAIAAAALVYGFRPPAVTVAAPTRGDAAEVVYATGVVEPETWAKVTPLVRERIVELCNCEGQPVRKGAVLARLDDREAQAVLAELEARLKFAAEDLGRLKQLAARSVASQQSLDRARADVAQLEALIAGQKARIGSYVLRAPVDGVVLRQDGDVGEIAEPGAVLFWVGRPRPLLVVAEINEEDIPRIKVGQRALLSADAFPGRGLDAVVDSITPKGDPVTKTYRVYFALPADTPLLIGMTVEVNAIVRVSENALLVPAEAVNGAAVFVVGADNVARRRRLDIGIRGLTDIEVLSGLGEDARVITPFPADLADGARVDPRKG